MDEATVPLAALEAVSDEETTASHMRARHRSFYKALLLSFGVLLCSVGLIVQMYEDGTLDFDNVLTDLYVVMQVVTTIGYGDITPVRPSGRMWYTVYIVLVLVLVAYGVSLGQDWAVRKSKHKLEEKMKSIGQHHKHVTGLKCKTDFWAAVGLWIFMVALGTAFYAWYEDCSCSYGRTAAPNASCTEDASYEVCVASGGQVKTPVDALYFSVVTMTTIGFGDLTPQTPLGRAFGIVYALFGVAITAYFITQLSDEVFSPLKESAKELKPEAADEIDHELFREIDKAGNGVLTRAEYMEFVLVKHDVVTRRVMDSINKQFDELDLDGTNVIRWEEIQMAQHQMRNPLSTQSSTEESAEE